MPSLVRRSLSSQPWRAGFSRSHSIINSVLNMICYDINKFYRIRPAPIRRPRERIPHTVRRSVFWFRKLRSFTGENDDRALHPRLRNHFYYRRWYQWVYLQPDAAWGEAPPFLHHHPYKYPRQFLCHRRNALGILPLGILWGLHRIDHRNDRRPIHQTSSNLSIRGYMRSEVS